MVNPSSRPERVYHQDYIARIRYSNALPPPPGPPKLLDIPTDGLARYTSASFASRMAREQPLNIEVDAELGMPIDLVGMPGIFDGDESCKSPIVLSGSQFCLTTSPIQLSKHLFILLPSIPAIKLSSDLLPLLVNLLLSLRGLAFFEEPSISPQSRTAHASSQILPETLLSLPARLGGRSSQTAPAMILLTSCDLL